MEPITLSYSWMAAIRAFVNLAKVTFGESLNWEKSITKPSPNNMKVIPVNFSTEHKQMLSHLQ